MWGKSVSTAFQCMPLCLPGRHEWTNGLEPGDLRRMQRNAFAKRDPGSLPREKRSDEGRFAAPPNGKNDKFLRKIFTNR